MDVRGRRVLVTGASRGVGAGLAEGLVEAGADVALVARDSDRLRAAAAATGGTAYPCDLADLDSLPDLVERVEADGPVDILVNNAGVANVGWYVDRTVDEIDQVVRVNLQAPMHLCRLLIPRMLERDRGHIVTISSMAAVFAPPGLATYGATKAGVSQFMAGLRADLRDDPIAFTTVHLAAVRTDMDDEARSYGPLRVLADQSPGYEFVTMDKYVTTVVDAIRKERAEVRIPTLMAPLAMATNLPRKVGRLMFKRVMAKQARTDP